CPCSQVPERKPQARSRRVCASPWRSSRCCRAIRSRAEVRTQARPKYTGTMLHDSPIIVILVSALGLALVFGTIANRLRLSPLVGYLLAGVVIGPFTPGLVVDPRLTLQLAEVGVILLMFGVGLHFSPRDLMSVRNVALPGAILQVVIATALGDGAAVLFG